MAGVTASCQVCGFPIFDEQTRRMLCDKCAANITDAVFCDHANESPAECTCGPNCYCKVIGTCKNRIPAKKKSKKRVKKEPKDRQSFLRKFDLDLENNGTGD